MSESPTIQPEPQERVDCTWCGWPVGHDWKCAMALTIPSKRFGWEGLNEDDREYMRQEYKRRFGKEMRFPDGTLC